MSGLRSRPLFGHLPIPKRRAPIFTGPCKRFPTCSRIRSAGSPPGLITSLTFCFIRSPASSSTSYVSRTAFLHVPPYFLQRSLPSLPSTAPPSPPPPHRPPPPPPPSPSPPPPP